METKPKQIRETVLSKLSCQRQTTQLKTTPHSIVFPAERISQELPCRGWLLCPRPPPPLGLSLTVIKERRERSQSVMSLQGRLVRFPWGQASRYSGRITLWANKEDNQLPSKTVSPEEGLHVKRRSQRKLQRPSFGLRLARWGRRCPELLRAALCHTLPSVPIFFVLFQKSLGLDLHPFSRFSLETRAGCVKKRILEYSSNFVAEKNNEINEM